MKTYKVKIVEILEREVLVEANSGEQAVEKVKKDYRDEKIVLDSDDFTGVDFKWHYEPQGGKNETR